MVEYDILIKNALISEGTGRREYLGSIGVIGDRVVATGDVSGDATRIIDASGYKALPGFIDAHSHAERNILWYPKCESYIMQGVTTFIGGQCGGSSAPLADKIGLPGMLKDYSMEISPYKFKRENNRWSIEQVNEWMKKRYGWTINYRTIGEFFKQVEDKGVSVNYAPLVGHGTIRRYVMGSDYKRDSKSEERSQMHELIHQAMKEGCIGMSTGLDYDPDVFASHEEIVEAVSQLKEYDGVYSPHWKRTGRRQGTLVGRAPVDRVKSMLECVDVQKRSGVRLHFAHLDAAWTTHPAASDEISAAILKDTFDNIIADVDDALNVTWNTLPFFIRGGFSIMPYISSRLSPWLRELGSREELSKWLKVKDFREEIKDAIRTGKLYVSVDYNPYTNPDWAKKIFILKHKSPNVDGKSVAQIAVDRNSDPLETWFDLMAEDPDARGVREMSVNKGTYYMFYKHPCGCLGLDLSGVYDDKYEAPYPPYNIPGIFTYSAFPIFYDKFVKKDKTLTLQDAVNATSTMAAKVHRLEGRGTINEGSYADIVLMDYDNLEIRSTEVEPRQYPGGIEYVLVNGVPVVEKGQHTGATPGRVLRRT